MLAAQRAGHAAERRLGAGAPGGLAAYRAGGWWPGPAE